MPARTTTPRPPLTDVIAANIVILNALDSLPDRPYSTDDVKNLPADILTLERDALAVAFTYRAQRGMISITDIRTAIEKSPTVDLRHFAMAPRTGIEILQEQGLLSMGSVHEF